MRTSSLCRLLLGLPLLPLLACTPAPKKEPPKAAAPAGTSVGQLTTLLSIRLQPGGVEVQSSGSGWTPLSAGAEIPAGATLRTQPGVQARLGLRDGTVVHLNEQSELRLSSPRALSLAAGELLVEVVPGSGAPVEIETRTSQIHVTGTKLNVKADGEQTQVDVTRGTVEVAGRRGGARVEVGAGERAVINTSGAPRITLSSDLAEVTRWSRELAPLPGNPESVQPGIGSLEARVPLQGKSFALSLARQQVRAIVQDNVARTEIEQEWYNSSSQTLEGTYRFPLPAGATISRLALWVGNKLEEGEIVERQRARQIFRQIVDDTVRPRDPALLEWVGGRTFQMKIFPLPPRASRKVIIGYTQVLGASHGRYRYEYPMASDPGRATTVGRFQLDLQVVSTRGLPVVQTPLYPTTTEKDQSSVRLRYEASRFRPAASFVANVQPASQPPELQLALYEPEPDRRQARCAAAANPAMAAERSTVGAPAAACGDRGGFFMAVLRPELPAQSRPQPRDYLFLLDASHSAGKRGWGLQLAALEAFLTEMDLRSRFNLMVCDASCRSGGSFEKPSAAARQAALRFAKAITPGGSSNLQLAFEEAGRLLASTGSKQAQVIYLGDGRPSAGELREPDLARRVVNALRPVGARLSAVQIGEDVSELLLPEATRRLSGSVHRLGAGDDVAQLVFDVVAAQYRPALSDIELSFEGLDVHHVYPGRLPSLTAGGEAVLVGRYQQGGQGTLLVRGLLEGKPFERRFPIHLSAERHERAGNRFIPRVWAQHHLEALTLEDYGLNRSEIVRVSKAYTVLSRATAFLVLENEKMYQEFGVRRTRHQNDFKAGLAAVRDGKDQPEMAASPAPAADQALGSGSAGEVAGGAIRAESAKKPTMTAAPAEERPRAASSDKEDGDSLGDSQAAPAAEPAAAPRPARVSVEAKREAPKAKMPAPEASSIRADDEVSPSMIRGRMSRRYLPPRQVVSVQLLGDPGPSTAGLRQEENLRAQVARSPLRRGLHAAYHRVLLKNGSLDEALRHAQEWAELDGATAAAVAALADVQALRADLATALRTRAGTVDLEPASSRWHQQLADMYRHKGQLRQSCAHLWSLVSLAPKRIERYAALTRCLAGLPDGRDTALQVLTEVPPDLVRGQAAQLAKLHRELQAGIIGPAPRLAGPVLLQATWDAPVDLDLVLVTPSGERISALARGRAGGVELDSRDGRSAEVLRLGQLRDGDYRVEVVRLADGSEASKGSSSVSGTLRLRAGDQARTIPFVLNGASRPLAQFSARHTYPRYYR